MTDNAWGDNGDNTTIRWSPLAHYDAGVAAKQNNEHVTALAEAALGLLLLQIRGHGGA